MTLWMKRCVSAGVLVGAAWITGTGTASATTCDNGGMIGSGTVICSAPVTSG